MHGIQQAPRYWIVPVALATTCEQLQGETLSGASPRWRDQARRGLAVDCVTGASLVANRARYALASGKTIARLVQD